MAMTGFRVRRQRPHRRRRRFRPRALCRATRPRDRQHGGGNGIRGGSRTDTLTNIEGHRRQRLRGHLQRRRFTGTLAFPAPRSATTSSRAAAGNDTVIGDVNALGAYLTAGFLCQRHRGRHGGPCRGHRRRRRLGRPRHLRRPRHPRRGARATTIRSSAATTASAPSRCSRASPATTASTAAVASTAPTTTRIRRRRPASPSIWPRAP